MFSYIYNTMLKLGCQYVLKNILFTNRITMVYIKLNIDFLVITFIILSIVIL